MAFQTVHGLWLSEHKDNKMDKVISINMRRSCYCEKYRGQKADTTCKHCYMDSMMGYAGLMEHCESNTDLLSKCDCITEEDVMEIRMFCKIKHCTQVRFLAVGELHRAENLLVFLFIAKGLEVYHIQCTLWTKAYDILADVCNSGMYTKPSNMTIVQSSLLVNHEMKPCCKWVDVVFTVYTADYVIEHKIKPNCGGKWCSECRFCYNYLLNTGIVRYVREVLKAHQRRKDFKQYLEEIGLDESEL